MQIPIGIAAPVIESARAVDLFDLQLPVAHRRDIAREPVIGDAGLQPRGLLFLQQAGGQGIAPSEDFRQMRPATQIGGGEQAAQHDERPGDRPMPGDADQYRRSPQ